ncbi:MAG TPA: LecA/PA-IL family lectin [Pyrinomonadaceae bacterium]|nr:LecA/PA-IL family lectin [Pyrinomonadaceae bacterium]
MYFRSKLFRAISISSLIISLTAFAFADTIRLKDGGIIKGQIVSFDNGTFVIAFGEGSRRRQLTFTAAEIESIQFDSRAMTDNSAQYSRPVSTAPQDTETPRKAPTVRVTDNLPKSQPVQTAKVTVPEPQKPAPQRTQTTQATPSDDDTISVAAEQPATTTASNPTSPSTKPVAINVKVLGDNTNNGWTNSGWVVRKGQKIHITADGEISLGGGNKTSASGSYTINDDSKLMKSVPTGALIAVIGDDNNDFIYVGSEREFTATRDGSLFLGVNEGNLSDNSGTYDVKIEISQ